MAKNLELRAKMEDHEAMAQFGFPKYGPHPELHCSHVHLHTCCICGQETNSLHIKTLDELHEQAIQSEAEMESIDHSAMNG